MVGPICEKAGTAMLNLLRYALIEIFFVSPGRLCISTELATYVMPMQPYGFSQRSSEWLNLEMHVFHIGSFVRNTPQLSQLCLR